MFERFTEQARRTLFFARYEASRLGVRFIETEHLLSGLIRDDKGLASHILAEVHQGPRCAHLAFIPAKVATPGHLPRASTDGNLTKNLDKIGLRLWTGSTPTCW